MKRIVRNRCLVAVAAAFWSAAALAGPSSPWGDSGDVVHEPPPPVSNQMCLGGWTASPATIDAADKTGQYTCTAAGTGAGETARCDGLAGYQPQPSLAIQSQPSGLGTVVGETLTGPPITVTNGHGVYTCGNPTILARLHR